MKTIILISLIFISISSVIAMQSQQGKLDLKQQKLQNSHLSKAFSQMIQLQAKVKSQEGEQRLFEALDLLQTNLEATRDAENFQFSNEAANKDTEVTRVSEVINQLNRQISVLQEALETYNREGEGLQTELSSQREQLTVVVDGAQAETLYLENIASQYTADQADYTSVIDLLTQALAKLQEASGASSTWTSFLETNAQTGLASLMEVSLKKIKKSAMYKPVLNLFVQLTSSTSTPDRLSINRASTALGDLRTYYQSGQEALTVAYNAAVEEHTGLLDQLNSEISRFSHQLIPRTEQSIQANEGNKAAANSAVESQQYDLAQNQETLATLQAAWTEREEIHQGLVSQYAEELQITQEAVNVLARQFPQN